MAPIQSASVVAPTLAEPAEVGALAALHARAFDRPWSASDIEAVLSGQGGAALRVGAPPQGFALLRVVLGEAEILAVAVEPAARRTGLGRTLIEAALAHAADAAAETVWLEVAEDNTAARALYLRAGFAEIGRRRGYYPRPDAPVDALILQRRLNSP